MVMIAAIPDAVGKPVEGALEPEPSVPQKAVPERGVPSQALPSPALPDPALLEPTIPGALPTLPAPALPAPALPAPGQAGEPDLCPGDIAQWELPSWEDIVRAHSGRVYRLAFRLTGNQHDAEDLTQEVFVRVFRSLSSYTPGTFEGWLHRITTNLFLDGARRRQRIRFEGLGDEVAQRIPGSQPSPAQVFDERHFDGDVQAALRSLPPDYRAAVVLCDIEGFSYEEIAATLGVKLGTVRSRIHRGRAQLRADLAHRQRSSAPPSRGVPNPGKTGPGKAGG
jgi:RNA polymerase sigma factor (sigma-70 family)